ncbi:hypothetical protein LNQ03_00405 [Klebsiella pneumoniae subsp. pneumoniae]|nr:hypothetical protein [Klebsiella pneumoniae subsp. pneumoniae]
MPIIEVSGRTYLVEVRYRPIVEEADDTERDQLQARSLMRLTNWGAKGPAIF